MAVGPPVKKNAMQESISNMEMSVSVFDSEISSRDAPLHGHK